MKVTFKHWTKYIMVISIWGFILYYIISIFYSQYEIRWLYKNGKQTVGFVYKDKVIGKGGPNVYYYFYVNNRYYPDVCGRKRHISTINKFYIVYYDPKNPKNSTLDFNNEVNPDSTYKFFSTKVNLFKEEIKKVKGSY